MDYILHTNFLRLMTSLTFWGNVLLVLAITLVTYWVVSKILAILHKRIARWAEEHNNGSAYKVFLDVLRKTRRILILFAAFLFSLQFVSLPDRNTVQFPTPGSWCWRCKSLSGSIRRCSRGCTIP